MSGQSIWQGIDSNQNIKYQLINRINDYFSKRSYITALLKTNRYDKMKNMEDKKYVQNADERKK